MTTSRLAGLFETCRAENRSALIGYLPTGYPDVPTSISAMTAMVESGCDIVEVGIAYSDPGMDGPTIAAATNVALQGGVRVRDALTAVEAISNAGGRAVVMTYWNPVLRWGVDAFARDLVAAGGLGLITPDLIVDEADEWIRVSDAHGLDRIFLVAPSSTPERLATTVAASRGFVYAASTMGVTGARDAVSDAAPEQRLVGRTATRAADIYALGLMLNEMFTMEVPHGTEFRTIAQSQPAFGYLDGVVAQMLRQNPDERPDSIDVIKDLLQRGQAAEVSRQRLIATKNEVIRVGDIDDDLAFTPPKIVQANWDGGWLTLTLDRPVHEAWVSRTASQISASRVGVDRCGTAGTARQRGDEAGVEATAQGCDRVWNMPFRPERGSLWVCNRREWEIFG